MKSEKIKRAESHLHLVVGNLTVDEELQADGRAEKRAGEAERYVGCAGHWLKEALDDPGERTGEVIDRVREVLHKQ